MQIINDIKAALSDSTAIPQTRADNRDKARVAAEQRTNTCNPKKYRHGRHRAKVAKNRSEDGRHLWSTSRRQITKQSQESGEISLSRKSQRSSKPTGFFTRRSSNGRKRTQRKQARIIHDSKDLCMLFLHIIGAE